MKETDLAKKVIDWLLENQWEIYQEVDTGSSIADIVAVHGQLIWTIECKLSLSLELIAQAMEWIKVSHFVSIAIPARKIKHGMKSRYVARKILKHYGIGMIEVKRNSNNKFLDVNNQSVAPRLNRFARAKFIRGALCYQQKYWAKAGSKSGRFTDFKFTCMKIERVVKRYPGIKLKDLIDKLNDHHYASDQSARASISNLARKGIIPGIVCKRDGKNLKFYLE